MEEGYIEVYTRPQDLEEVRRVIGADRHVVSAELSLVAKTTIMLGEEKAVQTLKFLDQLEELEDVQRVFANVDFSEATLEKLRQGS